jgi:hypothetical protein
VSTSAVFAFQLISWCSVITVHRFTIQLVHLLAQFIVIPVIVPVGTAHQSFISFHVVQSKTAKCPFVALAGQDTSPAPAAHQLAYISYSTQFFITFLITLLIISYL